MDKKALRADFFMLLTACIWGFSFVPQKTSMEHIGPFTYNGIRFLLGSLSLLPIMLFLESKKSKAQRKNNSKNLIPSCLLAGTALFVAVSLQQLGIVYINPGNSGFITGMYVVFVPLFGIVLGRKTGIPTWIGAALAFTGLFFVCVVANIENISTENFSSSMLGVIRNLNKGDILTFVCSFFWTFHVLLIDALVKKVEAIKLSMGQFLVCGILALTAAMFDVSALTGIRADTIRLAELFPEQFKALGAEIFTQGWSFSALSEGLGQILYGGFLAVGVAYTLQVFAQQYAPPAHAAIILSLEAVFAALGGILLLAEPVNAFKLTGFILMLSGMIFTQWDVITGGLKKEKPKRKP